MIPPSEDVGAYLELQKEIDLVIPRGSYKLVQSIEVPLSPLFSSVPSPFLTHMSFSSLGFVTIRVLCDVVMFEDSLSFSPILFSPFVIYFSIVSPIISLF